MEPNFTSALRTCIEKNLGRRILSSTDCQYLYNDITQKTGVNISINTLRRFFNLMFAKHEQSICTLDILARYCGFTSYDNFIRSSNSMASSESNQQNAELLNYLVMLFKNIDVVDVNDFTFYKLVAKTITFLESHSSLIDEFQFEIAKTINGQTFYFEHFVNIDRLNSYYGEGLRYYLNEKRAIDAQLFGNYLYCLRYFLTMNVIELNKRHNNIIIYNISKTMSSASVAYYFSAQILYAHATEMNPEPILIKARNYYLTFDSSKENQLTVINFFNTLSQALILTEQYEEALFYIDDMLNFIKKSKLHTHDNSLLPNTFMLKAIALYNCGNKIMAKQLFDTINPLSFFFLSKEFMTILYLSLKQCFKKNSIEQSHISDLIRKTGFYLLAAKNNTLSTFPHRTEKAQSKRTKFYHHYPEPTESKEIAP